MKNKLQYFRDTSRPNPELFRCISPTMLSDALMKPTMYTMVCSGWLQRVAAVSCILLFASRSSSSTTVGISPRHTQQTPEKINIRVMGIQFLVISNGFDCYAASRLNRCILHSTRVTATATAVSRHVVRLCSPTTARSPEQPPKATRRKTYPWLLMTRSYCVPTCI